MYDPTEDAGLQFSYHIKAKIGCLKRKHTH